MVENSIDDQPATCQPQDREKCSNGRLVGMLANSRTSLATGWQGYPPLENRKVTGNEWAMIVAPDADYWRVTSLEPNSR